MEDNDKMTEVTVVEPVGAPTAREELENLLNEYLPEEKRTGDVEQMALDFIKEQIEMNNRIVERLADEPRLAQVFADVVAGTRKPGAALARYFGKNLVSAEEGTPEYEELMKADEEYANEYNESKARREQQNASSLEFFEAFEDYLANNGLDKEKYMDAVYNEVIIPSLELKVDENLFARLVKAVDYDRDVEDAFAAGNIKGRNTNINEMRGKIGDGMPKGLTSQAAPVEQPKRKVNSLIAKALNA